MGAARRAPQRRGGGRSRGGRGKARPTGGGGGATGGGRGAAPPPREEAAVRGGGGARPGSRGRRWGRRRLDGGRRLGRGEVGLDRLDLPLGHHHVRAVGVERDVAAVLLERELLLASGPVRLAQPEHG